ncbi:MAG: ATP-dependent DNA helicase RecG, partial [Eubacteriales bacterium]
GDVGSGKTAVAAAATFAVASNGGQVAFMAPTEILAEQHHRALSALFAPLGITTALLTGSLKAREKTVIKGDITSGNVQLVIGTHALITSDVAFQNLELVIADEQHKFGVAQRAALAEKGFAPHLLVMSATPIPRTLALILYGDLDVSIMDELPPGRQTIDSFLVSESKRHRMYNFIRQQVENSNQVYVVCPAIEDNPDSDLTPAAVVAEELGNVIFPDLTVGLLHGKMKAAEKEAVMHQYAGGEIQILVSTTVVEVGVDVPNTTLMVIENADRFGLSQLHQLRGRVGRGKDKSFCVLISNNTNVETRARLKTFCSTTNGFEIAQADLELRGPGDFFGSRQSGLPLFKVANLALDLDVLKTAQDASITYLQSHPNIQSNKPLIARISNLFEENMALN